MRLLKHLTPLSEPGEGILCALLSWDPSWNAANSSGAPRIRTWDCWRGDHKVPKGAGARLEELGMFILEERRLSGHLTAACRV